MSHATSVPGVQIVECGRKIHEEKKRKRGILHLLIPNVEPIAYVFSVMFTPGFL